MTKTTQMQALDEAVVKGGGIVAFSRALGISPQAVNGGWRRRGWVPQLRAMQIERLWGVPARSLMDPKLVDALAEHDARDVL